MEDYFVLLRRKITSKPSWSPAEFKRLPDVHSCNRASAATSGPYRTLSSGRSRYRQARIPATDGAATGAKASGGGGGGFEAAVLRRPATVQACRSTPQTVAELSLIPNYNFRYAKRSTQNSTEDKPGNEPEAPFSLFSPCFQKNMAGNAWLKTVIFEGRLKSRGKNSDLIGGGGTKRLENMISAQLL